MSSAGKGTNKANQRQGRTHKRQYDNYAASNRRTHNKIRRLLKHLKRFPMDVGTANCLVRYGAELGNKTYQTYLDKATALRRERKKPLSTGGTSGTTAV